MEKEFLEESGYSFEIMARRETSTVWAWASFWAGSPPGGNGDSPKGLI